MLVFYIERKITCEKVHSPSIPTRVMWLFIQTTILIQLIGGPEKSRFRITALQQRWKGEFTMKYYY